MGKSPRFWLFNDLCPKKGGDALDEANLSQPQNLAESGILLSHLFYGAVNIATKPGIQAGALLMAVANELRRASLLIPAHRA